MAEKKTTKPDMTVDERISTEEKRLEKFYGKMTRVKKGIAIGLIERAAFMRIQCEDLEKYLNENGWTEMFSQGDQEPYARARPQGQSYLTLNANYQKIIRQLNDMLPPPDPKTSDDGFANFVTGREEI